MSFFFKEASGVNADLLRHREKEAKLREAISELEGNTDEESTVILRSLKNILGKLLQSKAKVVAKIGKEK